MAWTNTKYFTKYVHGDSDELSDFWDYDAPQQDKFHYAFYEVTLSCEVDLDTGEVRCWGVNDQALENPVRV